MKAIVYTQYGGPDQLQLKEVDKPTPRENEVLIRVHATSINSWDYDSLLGNSILVRLIGGLRKPKHQILGCDIAGEVEAIGANVKSIQVGDAVFGDNSGEGWGGFAEYVCMKESLLAKKPTAISFEEASTIPQAGLLALQGLRDVGQIRSGQKVLINGAGGGVGSFAIQLAKSHDTEVTAVDRGNKFEIMRSLGADHFIDYTKENFTRNGKGYDLILENIATHSMFAYKRALNPNGIFVMTGGTTARILQLALLAKLISWTGNRRITLVGLQYSPKDMTHLAELMASGKIKSSIDKCFPLSETAGAFSYFAKGDYKGKVVISVR